MQAVIWPVYRGWSAVWREASTGQRPPAEFYEPYRAKIAACLGEMGVAAANLPAPAWTKNPKNDADAICRSRFQAQNIFLDALRSCGVDAMNLGDLLRQGSFLETAAKLGRNPSGGDLVSVGGDFAARAKSLAAAARSARINPAPMSTDDLTAAFAGWTSLKIAEESFLPALLKNIGDASLRSLGDATRQKELRTLQEKIEADRKKSGRWSEWLTGEGPTDVIKFLMFAQSAMK